MEQQKLEYIVQLVYEVNRAYSNSLGDNSFQPWDKAADWQKDTIRKGIMFTIANPDAGPDASHRSWLDEKERTGWRYGPVKDAEAKTHPCFVHYDDLPPEQKAKDYIFQAVVKTCLRQMGEASEAVSGLIERVRKIEPDTSEAGIEAAIVAAGKTAPRLTPEEIDNAIVSEGYYVWPGTTMTICLLTLRNGFNVIGYSAAASPENFDKTIGRTVSKRNAREKIWALEGYLLRTRLCEQSAIKAGDA